ncbi:hypothetical protein KPL37_17420 [Clostridium frigoris]|uniref:DUF6938 domain-containing protein n=1 Tax=Clostridium frigoris TaxID=205327 RepID=A0ABS6BY27_9CLOT|nr:hypothetical protein [Clostridium frigoris]MBU3161489.1 hypothetical protein [Clostridium frigoris]
MIKSVGGHEARSAIRSAEVGDGTIECGEIDNGAYKVVELAVNGRRGLQS